MNVENLTYLITVSFAVFLVCFCFSLVMDMVVCISNPARTHVLSKQTKVNHYD